MFAALSFHYVRDDFGRFPGIHGVTPKEFARQLDRLARLGEFIGPEDLYRARSGGKLPERAFLITFDDGLKEQFELALPVLRERNIPAIFFVSTGPVAEKFVADVHKLHMLRSRIEPDVVESSLRSFLERHGLSGIWPGPDDMPVNYYPYDSRGVRQVKYVLNHLLQGEMRSAFIDHLFRDEFGDAEAEIAEQLYVSVEQVRELQKLGFLGSHAHRHLPLGYQSLDRAQRDVETSHRLFRDWCGAAPAVFSYPFGNRPNCSPAIAQIVAANGVDFAFTMERGINADLRAPLHLGRFSENDVPGGKAWEGDDAAFFEQAPMAKWYREEEAA